MSMDLFASNTLDSHTLALGCVVEFAAHTAITEHAEPLFAALMSEVDWEQRSVTIAGRSIPQPRLVSWMGEPGLSYTYSGLTLQAKPWTDSVLRIKHEVETLTQSRFNTVLANLYRGGADSMGFHSDDEPELGPQPVIASVSLGAVRRFVIRTKQVSTRQQFHFDLDAGSVLVMRGHTQELFEHGVPKTSTSVGPRINLTFRTIV